MVPTPFSQQKLQDNLLKTLEQAKHRKMDAAEVSMSMETGFLVTVRHGEVETVEHHQAKSLTISVYQDYRSGTATTSDLSIDALYAALDKACAIARYAGQDTFGGLPDVEQMAYNYPDLQLYHHWEITPAEAIDLAIECDVVARKQDSRITDSEGSSIGSYDSLKLYGNTHGFLGHYPQSLQSINCSVVAQSGQKKQSDHEYSVARSAADLDEPIMIAKQAAQKVLRRLDPRRLTTRRCPVIFHAPVAKSLLGHFIAAISGRNLYRKSSFLLDHLGKTIFPSQMHIYQQPHLIGGIASMPFDQEGVRTRDLDYVLDGVLQSYVLGTYSARKLGMATTGNAGGVYNLGLSHDNLNLSTVQKKMGTGLLVVELMGQGINILTGNYSRGAAGFWVEQGEIQYPVEEITIAGN